MLRCSVRGFWLAPRDLGLSAEWTCGFARLRVSGYGVEHKAMAEVEGRR